MVSHKKDKEKKASSKNVSFDDLEVIQPTKDLDGKKKWRFPRLYKLEKSGDLRCWEIGFNGVSLITRYGKVGENYKLTERPKTIKTNKSGRSLFEQALLECRSKDKTQRRNQDYTPDKDQAKFPFKPTLAQEYKPGMISDKENPERISGNWGIEVKLDGIRAIFQLNDEGEPEFRSRNKTLIKFQDHLYRICKKLLKKIPGCLRLDGELIVDGRSFQDTAKAVRCSKNKNEDEDLVTMYNIFDFIPVKDKYTYVERLEMIRTAYEECVGTDVFETHKGNPRCRGVVVLGYIKLKYTEEITTYLTIFENLGFEGAMLRNLDMKYVFGRTKELLKVKNFFDDEAVVMEVLEGKGQLEKAAAKFKVKHRTGMIFKVTMSATLEEKREWFRNPETVVGKEVTYKYQEESNDGVPRFGIGLAIRDYEGEPDEEDRREKEKSRKKKPADEESESEDE